MIKAGIVKAIECSNYKDFEELGGTAKVDLNFHITTEGIFPLMVAVAKGEYLFVLLTLFVASE